MFFEVRDNTLLDWELAVGIFCAWSVETLVPKGAWNFHRQGGQSKWTCCKQKNPYEIALLGTKL